MVWVLIAAVSNPLSNPYVPKRKLSACSQWLQSWLKLTNTAFDDLAIFIAPYIHVQSRDLGRRRSCAGSFSSTSNAFPRRQRARPCNHATAIVFSAVTMGVARAQAYCDNPGPAVANRALFDSNSFDILVDGRATASIPNCLDDFIQPPTTTNIRIKVSMAPTALPGLVLSGGPSWMMRESSMCSRFLILTLWLPVP
jgi:hypothetical protein